MSTGWWKRELSWTTRPSFPFCLYSGYIFLMPIRRVHSFVAWPLERSLSDNNVLKTILIGRPSHSNHFLRIALSLVNNRYYSSWNVNRKKANDEWQDTLAAGYHHQHDHHLGIEQHLLDKKRDDQFDLPTEFCRIVQRRIPFRTKCLHWLRWSVSMQEEPSSINNVLDLDVKKSSQILLREDREERKFLFTCVSVITFLLLLCGRQVFFHARSMVATIVVGWLVNRYYTATDTQAPLDLFTIYLLVWQFVQLICHWESHELWWPALILKQASFCLFAAFIAFIQYDILFRHLPSEFHFAALCFYSLFDM